MPAFYLNLRAAFAPLCLLLAFVGCVPTVRVSTPDPVKIDVKMQVDVVSKEESKKANQTAVNIKVAEGRRARMAEVQTLKNDRVIGEDREGYLGVRNVPQDANYAAYAKRITQEENNDRVLLYMSNAQSQNKPLELIQREFSKLWRDRSFPGEWVQQEDGNWIAK